MNNTAENDFFGFPKVKWIYLTGEVDNNNNNNNDRLTAFDPGQPG